MFSSASLYCSLEASFLFGEEFWQRVPDFDFLVEVGTISPEDATLFQYVEKAEEAWEKIKAANGFKGK